MNGAVTVLPRGGLTPTHEVFDGKLGALTGEGR